MGASIKAHRARWALVVDGPLGTHAFVLLDPAAARPAATGRRDVEPRWIAVAVPGHEAEKGRVLDHAQVERIVMPPDFTARLRASLQPGDTLMVTDGAVLDHTTGTALTVVTADPPADDAARRGS